MDEATIHGNEGARAGSTAGLLQHLKIEYRTTEQLQPARRNARSHSRRQIEQIAASIARFGFVNPILIDAEDRVIAGHGRLAAARRLQLPQVPVLQLAHLSEADRRAYALADNRLAELAGWDRELLAVEFTELAALDIEIDLTITGFNAPEIDVILSGVRSLADEPDDQLDEVPAAGQPVSQPGDLWLAGDHRILCANALEEGSFTALMDGQVAEMVFTDPPYNVPIGGHVSGLGAAQHREFVMASGEMSPSEFTNFLETAFRLLAAHSVNGGIQFVCMDWRHLREILAAGYAAYSELKNLCVWAKDNGGMGSLYRSRHELVFVFKSGTGPHLNHVELGRHGRYRTNVWEYPGGSSLRAGRGQDLAMHPTVKPVALIADAILDCSRKGSIVLDPFGGSGSTLIAAERTGRQGYLMELDPSYVDVMVRRYQRTTGRDVRDARTGLTFEQTADQRRVEQQPDTSLPKEADHV